MIFELNEEQIAIQKMARDFAEKEIAPYARSDEKKDFLGNISETSFCYC